MNALKNAVKRIYRALPPAPSTNYLYRSFEVNPYELLPPNPIVVDIGSKDARAHYGFGPPPRGATVWCVDVEPGPGIDIVADAHELPMATSGSVDCVLCVSVLYATRRPAQVVQEIHRILKPGGVLYVSVPFVFPYCADPGDYYRFSYKGVEVLCDQFDKLDSGFNRGPASTMHELLVRFLAMLFCFNQGSIYTAAEYFFKWPLFWVKYLDKRLARYRMAHIIHSGSYFIGRKKTLSNN